MNGFWGGRSERAFVDVGVFNPYAPSNSYSSTMSCHKKHENIKKHVKIMRSGTCLFLFTSTGGMAPEAMVFTKYFPF